MLRKCAECDAVHKKSINTKENEYVSSGGKYYHKHCFIMLLRTRKKLPMSEEDATIEAMRLVAVSRKKQDELQDKDDFYQLLEKIYGIKPENSFFNRVSDIVSGKYKNNSPRKISYAELIDMYSNEKMLLKLKKIAFNKGIEEKGRMSWDLAVMFNEYPKYVNSKRRAIRDSEESKQALENINRYKISPDKRYKDIREKVSSDNKKSIKIDDLVDEILE